MAVNLSVLDRFVRFILGSFVISLGYLQSDAGFLLFDKRLTWVIGLGTILMALLGHCPIYRMMGISTCPKS